MKTKLELRQIFDSYKWSEMNTHVHTSLCDGKPELTLENIAAQALADGVKLIVLAPHFHKQLTDESATLYVDTDERILFALRQEVEQYKKKDGRIHFLISTEVDIVNAEGDLCMPYKKELYDVLDMVTPTLNFHPLLPLRAVDVTHPKGREKMHGEGLYKPMADKLGGVGKVLETMYEIEAKAILKCQYPAMLGHFFSAHAFNGPYCWFGTREEHIPIMQEGARKVISACQKAEALIDITGIRIPDRDVAKKRRDNGFFHDFQMWFLQECDKAGVGTYPGSDVHDLSQIRGTWFYDELFERS